MNAIDVIEEYIGCFNARDFSRVPELLHEDYSYRGSDGVVQRGPEAAVGLMETYAQAFSDSRLDMQEMWAMGDRVVCEYIGRGTHDGDFASIAPTGRTVAVHVANVFEVRDGKIFSEHEYVDLYALLRQLGAVPAMAA